MRRRAARAFRPGQFYRLQNYEMLAPRIAEAGTQHRAGDGRPGDDRRLDRSGKGLVSVIVLEMGGSSDICALLKPASRSC